MTTTKDPSGIEEAGQVAVAEREIDHDHIGKVLAPPGFIRRHTWNFVFVIEIVFIILIWQFLQGGIEIFPIKFVPAPSGIFTELVDLLGDTRTYDHILYSLRSFVVGYVLAAVVGITVGLLVGGSKLAELTIGPLVWTSYAVPRSALAPMIIVWFGLGLMSKVTLVFLLAVFPIIINTMEGVRHVDKTLVNAGKVFGGSTMQILRKIVVPALLPFILIGLRIAVVRGFIGVLLGEFLGSFKGLGKILNTASYNFETARALAIVVILIFLANVTMFLVSSIKKWVAPWHHEESLLGGGR